MRFLLLLLFAYSCQKPVNPDKEIWIYTSMYKDTVADLNEKLSRAFPGVEFHWYQAGSEEIAARANGEIMAGGIRADILISSDRFWYEELGRADMLHPYKNSHFAEVPDLLKNKEGKYTAVALPMMVLTYYKETIKNPPKTFLEMGEPQWKDKFTTGSPLSSGTNFTTMAMLQKNYGWKYFENLRKNGTISQGGNSAVIRRVQTLERPVGWVLLEDLLRLQGKDERLGIVYPDDGVVTQANILAITKRDPNRALAEKVAEWFFSQEGQSAMTRSYMYSPLPDFPAPKGAPELKALKTFEWSDEFLQKTTDERTDIKDKYMEIMFQ